MSRSQPPESERQPSRRSFLARLLSGAAGVWVTASGVGLLLSGRARSALAAGDPEAQGEPPRSAKKPAPPKYGGPVPGPKEKARPRKYGGPPKPPDDKPAEPPRARKYGGPPRKTKYGGVRRPKPKYGGPPRKTKYGGVRPSDLSAPEEP